MTPESLSTVLTQLKDLLPTLSGTMLLALAVYGAFKRAWVPWFAFKELRDDYDARGLDLKTALATIAQQNANEEQILELHRSREAHLESVNADLARQVSRQSDQLARLAERTGSRL